ncbi:class I SAM-dependent methyltransferase [Micromonospora zamorensis]|uniref:class I SAM-dependent methyltransferase n=1 Tax=Micromonospora zamorensis TaxID=709883 RepID=UPI003D98F1F8
MRFVDEVAQISAAQRRRAITDEIMDAIRVLSGPELAGVQRAAAVLTVGGGMSTAGSSGERLGPARDVVDRSEGRSFVGRTACRVCDSEMGDFGNGIVLGDVDVRYGRCAGCGLVAALDPDWLDRAYTEEINALDVGRLRRCLMMSDIVAFVLRGMGGQDVRCLDWAGGYGVLTRLLRDRGYDFHHHEPLAPNVFAKGVTASPDDGRYGLITAIEVLEHLVDPANELAAVAASTDLLLATTEPIPSPTPKPDEWWYYSPDTGQHVTFYTHQSLQQLGRKLGYRVLCGSFVHLFYRGKLPATARLAVTSPRLATLLGASIAPLDRRYGRTEADTAELGRRLRGALP